MHQRSASGSRAWIPALVVVMAFLPCGAWAAGGGGFSSVRVVGPEKPAALEKFAIDELAAAVARLPKPAGADARELVVIVGRPSTNQAVERRLTEQPDGQRAVRPETRPEGYAFRLDGNEVLIAGTDGPGTLYGTMDFIHYYLPKVWSGALTSLDVREAPKIELRGIWSWGGRICNYELFFDQLARWKLNLAILWHAQVPKNAAAVQDYAASRGIKLVWGFSWGWAEGTDWNNPESIARTEQAIGDSFEKEYAPLTPFGIYFQSNTEGGAATGQAEKFVGLVNRAAGKILSAHPNLWISCGVHFSSFTRDWQVLKGVDPRLNIMYEDIGSVPFSYASAQLKPEELAVCPKLNSLRGRDEDIGYIFKGFVNAPGGGDPQLIKDEATLKKLTAEYGVDAGNEEGWRRNLAHGMEVLKGLVQSPAKRKVVTMLMERGMWETRPWYPVCVVAEALWNPYQKPEDLQARVDACAEVVRVSPAKR